MNEEVKRGPGRPKKEDAETKTLSKQPFKVMRDFWPEEGGRVRKGTIIEMFADEALSGVATGALELI